MIMVEDADGVEEAESADSGESESINASHFDDSMNEVVLSPQSARKKILSRKLDDHFQDE